MHKSQWIGRRPAPPPTAPAAGRGYFATLAHTWGPPVIAAVVASVGSYLLATRSEVASKDRTFLELKIRHADEAVAALSDYVSTWRRLIVMCNSLVADEKLFESRWAGVNSAESKRQAQLLEVKRKRVEEQALTRPPKRDRVLKSMAHLKLYFSDPMLVDIDSFVGWDAQQQSKQCHEMPDPSLFDRHFATLLGRLRQEARK